MAVTMRIVTAITFMDSSFTGPAWQLACDEALLEACEAGEIQTDGILRFWEADVPFVVLGYGNKAALEVDLASNIPVFRRCTGGGSVLQGPGCLNYSLVLPIGDVPEFASITQTNCFIMRRHAKALAPLLKQEVQVEGHTDLAIGSRKFSGNSQRRKNRWLLFHGTFLLKCDFELMDKVLRPPSREPEYRKGRRHSEFLMTLDLPAGAVKQALAGAWNANPPFTNVSLPRIEALVETKYMRPEWTFRI